jgi:hypothetical protein
MDASGHANAYQLLPGYKRFLYVRLPITVSPGLAIGAYLEPEASALGLTGVSLYAFHKLGRYWGTRTFRREVIEPVAVAMSAVMRKGHVDGRGYTWVHVPQDFRDTEDSVIRVQLPQDWLAEKGDKQRLVDICAERLHVEELSPSWHSERGRFWVDLKVPPKPPKMITFNEAREDMSTSEDTAPVMGFGPRGKLVTFDLKLDSPHLVVAGGPGAGKSELVAGIIGQMMRAGYGIACLDSKFVSHMWLRKIPGVLYASEAEEQHDALVWLDEEVMRRARIIAAGGDPEQFVPLVALLEEMGAASNRLRAYWKTIKGPEDPMMSPALTALMNITSMGRELRIHVVLVGQSVTSKVTGGPENRENFGARALARATAAQWRMLAPQIKPAPIKRNAPGRWHLVVGDSLKELQAPFMNLKDAQAEADLIGWATGGQPIPDVVSMMLLGEGGTTRIPKIDTSEVVPPQAVSLRQYADEAGLELRTLERWRAKRSDFPVEVATGANRTKLYDRDHLKEFVRSRPLSEMLPDFE